MERLRVPSCNAHIGELRSQHATRSPESEGGGCPVPLGTWIVGFGALAPGGACPVTARGEVPRSGGSVMTFLAICKAWRFRPLGRLVPGEGGHRRRRRPAKGHAGRRASQSASSGVDRAEGACGRPADLAGLRATLAPGAASSPPRCALGSGSSDQAVVWPQWGLS